MITPPSQVPQGVCQRSRPLSAASPAASRRPRTTFELLPRRPAARSARSISRSPLPQGVDRPIYMYVPLLVGTEGAERPISMI